MSTWTESQHVSLQKSLSPVLQCIDIFSFGLSSKLQALIITSHEETSTPNNRFVKIYSTNSSSISFLFAFLPLCGIIFLDVLTLLLIWITAQQLYNWFSLNSKIFNILINWVFDEVKCNFLIICNRLMRPCVFRFHFTQIIYIFDVIWHQLKLHVYLSNQMFLKRNYEIKLGPFNLAPEEPSSAWILQSHLS